MAKSNIGPRITEKARAYLADNFQSANWGAEYVLESMPNLYRAALREIKGKFSQGELSLIIDVMNSTALTPGINDEVVGNCVDGIALDGLDQKWSVQSGPFIERLHVLTSFQVAVLTIWANGFWYGGGDTRPERNLEAYIKPLLAEGKTKTARKGDQER